jgi:hypothetical protein
MRFRALTHSSGLIVLKFFGTLKAFELNGIPKIGLLARYTTSIGTFILFFKRAGTY